MSSILFLLLLTICLSHVNNVVVIAAAQPSDLNILDLLHTNEDSLKDAVQAYKHGFNASLWSRNFQLPDGRKVNMISRTFTTDTLVSVIEQAVVDVPDVLTIIGPTSASQMVTALPSLKAHKLVAFAPLTESLLARFWEPSFYFLLMDTMFSVHALVRYAVNSLRLRQISFMYTTEVSFGDQEYEHAKEMLGSTDNNLASVFTLDGRVEYTPKDKEFQVEWEKFAETRPQAVIIMGDLHLTTISFIKQLMKDERTKDAFIPAPFILQELAVDAWVSGKAEGGNSYPGQLVTTGTYPLPTDETYVMVQRFRKVIDGYLTKSGQTTYPDPKGILSNHLGEMILAGWVAGEVFFKATLQYDPSLGREGFSTSIFEQRRYIIDDFVVGDFGGDVHPQIQKDIVAQKCNQGGTAVFLKVFENENRSYNEPTGLFQPTSNTCYLRKVPFYDPTAVVMVNFSDTDMGIPYEMSQIFLGVRAGVASVEEKQRHEITMEIISTPLSDSITVLNESQELYLTDIVMGAVLEDMLKIPNLVFLDPLFWTAHENTFMNNLIVLSPTVEQQLFVVAEYFAGLKEEPIHAVIRGDSSGSKMRLLERSLFTFDVKLSSSTSLPLGTSLENNIPTTGATIIIEVDPSDVQTFAAHLEANKNSRIIVLYAPFTSFYPMFISEFQDRESANRLLFFTHLPHWNDVNSTSETVITFHKIVTDSANWSPMSLSNYIATKVIQRSVQQLDMVNASSVMDYFYSTIVVDVGDITFGPFANNKSVTCASTSQKNGLDCAKNFGAASITIWSLARVWNPTEKIIFGPVTPSLVYRDPLTGLTRTQLIGIIAGSVVGVVILIAGIVALVCCLDTKNRSAPKDPEHPVTLIFTDIESSTALWATCPEIMPDAVATHHRLIRKLIKKYGCYEVKTIGDSFMIACKDAFAAVQLVGDLQTGFHQHNWKSNEIDDAYHVFEEQKAEEDEEYKPPTARLDAEVYRAYWNGLRVRAGVHTGLSDIRHDEVTKRYDYYGGTSNTAARTESVANGGQVLLTAAAYMALSSAEREGLTVTSLGAVALRGVPKPVVMYQLEAIPGRSFAALRLDREFVDMEDETSTLNGTESSATRSEALSPTAEALVSLFTDFFSPFPPPERLRVMEPICKRWNVSLPKKRKQMTPIEVCRSVIESLAIKLGRVIDRRHGTLNGRDDGTSTFRGSVAYSSDRRSTAVSFREAEHEKRRTRLSFFLSRRDTDNACSSTFSVQPPPSIILEDM